MIAASAARRRARVLSVTALALGAWTAAGQEGEPAPVPPEAYATVDGVAVLRTAVDADAAQGIPLPQALERRVTFEVLAQNLRREGHDPANLAPEALAEAVEALKAEAARRGVPAEVIEEGTLDPEALRVPLAFERYVEAQLTDEALQAYWEEHRLLLAGEVRAQHIAVAFTATRNAAVAAARCQELLTRLGETPGAEAFAALARDVSDDPLAPLTGGDLDWFGPDGATALGLALPRSLVRACFDLGEPGLVPYPVAGPRAMHVVRVSAVRLPEGATLEAHRGRVRLAASASLQRELIDRWRAAADVRYAEDAPRR